MENDVTESAGKGFTLIELPGLIAAATSGLRLVPIKLSGGRIFQQFETRMQREVFPMARQYQSVAGFNGIHAPGINVRRMIYDGLMTVAEPY